MPLRLRVIPRSAHEAHQAEGVGPTTERIVEFSDDLEEIRIGRRGDLELSLPFKALSSLHARIVHKKAGNAGRGNVWLLEDLDSKNGTYVGKNRLRPGEQRLLFAGDLLDLGQVQLMFDGHAAATSGAEGTATIARRLVDDLLVASASPGASAPTLSVISGAADVQTLKLLDRDRPYFIGRGKSCDLRFDLEELSRQHASFTRTWNGVALRDEGSKNGIQVNGSVVTNQRLADGDEIEMGPLKLLFMDPEDKYLRDIEDRDRAPRAARGEAPAPKPAVVMPAALAVSLPPAAVAPAAPPAAAPPPPSFGAAPAAGATPPKKVSRLAPRPTAAAGGASSVVTPSILDEHHPAIAARRPPPDPHSTQASEDAAFARQARKTAYLAVAVLVAIAAIVAYLTLTSGGA